MPEAEEIAVRRSRRVLGIAFLGTALTIWIGQAALAYFADVSICLSKTKIVRPEDRIAASVIHIRQDPLRTQLGVLSGGKLITDMVPISPSNCCTVQRGGWAGDTRITFWNVLWGGPTHFVKFERLSRMLPADTAGVYAGTNVCGDVVQGGVD